VPFFAEISNRVCLEAGHIFSLHSEVVSCGYVHCYVELVKRLLKWRWKKTKHKTLTFFVYCTVKK